MNVIDTLITDRTAADVSRWKALRAKGWEAMTEEERAEWQAGMRGGYNATDFNRVESAVLYLAEMLQTLPAELLQYAQDNGVAWDELFGFPFDPLDYTNIETKTTWQLGEFPSLPDRERYIANVRLLREAVEYATSDIPETMAKFTHEDANALEQALSGLHDALVALDADRRTLVENTAAAWYYSGDIYLGEV